ncbi:peptidoglycan -binding protein [Pontibaca methylaminivorans]|uniref:Chemotaxis protein MotB n=1 Tax=Pontibaca methylaminivorans TaxID=515897 RepID=A0A1R3WK28_9RHOB|nr:peptidoglycan -binding protein [Pontibaca methylaminivorans]SIT77776.1 chemotaxis protein MotB [Pontibaca methylaminivorans]
MALQRRSGQRFQTSIWPGFVDAMTGLLLVLIFLLTIFMVAHFVLRETVSGQESELDALSGELGTLSEALGLERRRASDLEARLGTLADSLALAEGKLEQQDSQLVSLQALRTAAEDRAQALEDELAGQVALAEATQEELETDLARALDRLALAEELSARQEQALQAADEAQRESEVEAQARLAEQQGIATRAEARRLQLGQQVAALRRQLGQLQALLDDSKERDQEAQAQIENLGQDLNAALARAASEERRRRMLEESERERLAKEAEELRRQAEDLERYRSEFFGQLRELLSGQEGVRIEGDRFVFSSEVLFPSGSADLSEKGREQVARVAGILRGIIDDIPSDLNWVIRVDGHTDTTPLSGSGRYSDNWELSQARALSVVRYLSGPLGLPPGRLSANGFGEFQPVDSSNTAEARAQNRRIELKLTEK